MILKTDKIYLLPITDDDTDDVVRWRNEEYVRNNFIYRGEFTSKTHRKWLKEKVETGQVIQFIIYTTDENRKVGSVYLRDVDHEKRTAEYGIFIGEKDALGHGYGNDAACLMVMYAMEELRFKKLMLRLMKGNEAALKSYLHAGFRIVEDKKDMQNGKEVIFMEIELNED